ncbi:MAG TPA: hypothetical protein VFQ50_04930, partial [Flavobacterium sp.]|nr:hypothetical protein [Flavobacterium sp.]
PSWEDTKAYVDANGPRSLPDTGVGALTHDINLTIIEFFKDFGYSLFYGFRQLGLIILFPFLFLASNIYRRNWSYSLFLPMVILTVIAAFSFIVISFVEPRWYGAILIPAIVFFTFYVKNIRNGQWFEYGNFIVMAILSLYGIYRLSGKI